MANVNKPFGLKPVRNISGNASMAESSYTIASGASGTIRLGDPVKMTGTGNNIVLADAGDVAVGVFIGCMYTDSNNNFQFSQQWLTGATTLDGTAAQALVWDDQKNIIWHVQCDSLAATDVGSLCDWAAGTGNSLFKTSGAYLAIGTTATDSKSLRILRLAEIAGNAYGAYAVAEVMFAEGTMLGIPAAITSTGV
jgi:hypothetical protein